MIQGLSQHMRPCAKPCLAKLLSVLEESLADFSLDINRVIVPLLEAALRESPDDYWLREEARAFGWNGRQFVQQIDLGAFCSRLKALTFDGLQEKGKGSYATVYKAVDRLSGDIITLNSKSGLEGSNKNFAYAGSKFGGIGLTQSFALELCAYNIKVNAICPGNYLDGPLWMDPERGLFVQYLHAGIYTSHCTRDHDLAPATLSCMVMYQREPDLSGYNALFNEITGFQLHVFTMASRQRYITGLSVSSI